MLPPSMITTSMARRKISDARRVVFLDTGYLVAVVSPKDNLHDLAVAWAPAVRGRLLVTEYVIVEFVNQLSTGMGRPHAHALVDIMSADPRYVVLEASPLLFSAGLELHRNRSDKEWSLTDCISFNVMRARGITAALTHDYHFVQAGFEALLRSAPPSTP